MGKQIWESILFSLEWRFYAYIITILFLWATTGHLAFAAVQALGLQVVLFIGNAIWYHTRTHGSGSFTLDALASRLATLITNSLLRKTKS